MIRDNQTNATHANCPVCDEVLNLSVPRVQDDTSGVIYCGAMCHHEAQFGIQPSPITQTEAASLDQAQAWMRTHREAS